MSCTGNDEQAICDQIDGGLKALEEYSIKKLQAENKALKETLDKTTDLVVDYQERLVKVEESRDDILKALKHLYNGTATYPAEPICDIIERAEALKEKANE